MAAYVSLISKDKFSQVKQFLVKQNAKLSPPSDHVSQASSRHGRCLDIRMLKVVSETAPMASPLPGGREGLGCLSQASSHPPWAAPGAALHSLTHHHLPFSAWSFSPRRVTLSLAHSPGWSEDGLVYV